jgi:hypothetical protein
VGNRLSSSSRGLAALSLMDLLDILTRELTAVFAFNSRKDRNQYIEHRDIRALAISTVDMPWPDISRISLMKGAR